MLPDESVGWWLIAVNKRGREDPVTRIDGAVLLLLCHMRRHTVLAYRLDDLGSVVILVRHQSAALAHRARHHDLGGIPFRRAVRLGRFHGHHQTMPVFHQGVPQVAQARLVPFSLLEELRVGIGRRGMGVVLALLALEINRRITPAVLWRLAGTILGLETLNRCPGFDQGAGHRAMLRGHQTAPLRQRQHLQVPTVAAVQRIEIAIQRAQQDIHDAPQFAQRMVLRNPLLQRPVPEQLRLRYIRSPHHQQHPFIHKTIVIYTRTNNQ